MTDAIVSARLMGVRVTAFVMVMGGLLVASTTIPIVRATGQSARYPELAFFLAYLAVWSIFLGIGLERRSWWAWDGSVYLAGLWTACFSLIPLTVLSRARTEFAPTVILFVIAVLLAVPAFLLIRYLFQPNVRNAFDPESIAASPVPDVWIRLIAIGTLFGSGTGLMELFNARPEPLFGMIDNRAALCIYEVFALFLSIYCGLGLYRLNELARRVTLAFFVLWQVQYLMWLFLAPVLNDRFTPFKICLSVFYSALVALQVWYLHMRRECFTTE